MDYERNNDLVAELKTRLVGRNRAADEVEQAHARVLDARRVEREWLDVLTQEEKALREVESELLTGVSSVPLIAAAQDRAGADLVASRPGSTPAANGSPELEANAWAMERPEKPKKGGKARKPMDDDIGALATADAAVRRKRKEAEIDS